MNWEYVTYDGLYSHTYDGLYSHPTLAYTAHEKFGRRMLRYRFDNVYGAEVLVLDGERFDVVYVKYTNVAGYMGCQEYDKHYGADAEKLTELLDEMSTRHMGRVSSIRELNLY